MLVALTQDHQALLSTLVLAIVQGSLFVGWGWASWRLARQRRDWERAAWLWFASCIPLALVGAVVVWMRGGDVTLTSPADPATSLLTFILYGVLFGGLLVLNLGSAQSTNAWRRGLDAAIIAGCLFFILWAALYRDIFAVSELPLSARSAVVATPFLDAALVTLAALAFAVPDKTRPRGYGLMLGGLVTVFLGDVVGATLKLQESPWVAPLSTAAGVAALALLAMSAVALLREAPWKATAKREEALWVRMLPVAALTPAMGSAIVTVAQHGALSQIQFWTAFSVIGLVLVQLALSVRQAAQLEAYLRSESAFKTQLLRFISHEVANPLSPLRVQLSILGKERPATEGRAWAIVDRSVERLLSLSKDVREMALAETQRLVTQVEVIDAGEQVSAAAQASVVLAQQRGLELILHAPLEPLPARLDRQRFGQVLDNLLGNALKFTHPPGKVTVRVERDGTQVRVRVTDTGIGLSPADREGLFQPFRRAQDGAAPGLGLGLYLCKAIMAELHGAVGVDSPGRGQGSTFWVTVPLEGHDLDPLPVGRLQPAPAVVEPLPTATIKLA